MISPRSQQARAIAGTNIALVKYWGKRDADLNLPATGSLSLTLRELGTTTQVRFLPNSTTANARDRVLANGAVADTTFAARVSGFLDLVRAMAGHDWTAEVRTENTIPTAAGLASSASGFAALAAAASRAANLTLSLSELSALARRGSGSAARSVYGGFVEMAPGTRSDGMDAFAQPILAEDAWAVRLVVAKTAVGPKAIGSTQAMAATAATSPYYRAWVDAVPADLANAKKAIADRDLERLGGVTERSALRMHASAMAAEPAILYWVPTTLAVIQQILAWRKSGGPCGYFTMDAGPHVKVLCAANEANAIAAGLGKIPGVIETLVAQPGPGVVARDEQEQSAP